MVGMYLDHFGLEAEPFSIAPNPRLLFMSRRHQEALAHLLYGVQHGGFVLLVGEVGTGKTTLCRRLLGQMPEACQLALILNPMLSVRDLLAYICDELGVTDIAGDSHKDYVDAINRKLLKTHAEGKRTLLIVDEAQNLSTEVLEQLRLLTNLETDDRKLLQIILIGQPELTAKLNASNLRQLAQRITARYHLKMLSEEELKSYVEFRLSACGCRRPLFSPAALRALYFCSRGTPRLINIIADRSLLGAYASGQERVGARLVLSAAREVMGLHSYMRQWTKAPLVLGSAAALALAIVGLLFSLLFFGSEPPQTASLDVATDAAEQSEWVAAPTVRPTDPVVASSRVAAAPVAALLGGAATPAVDAEEAVPDEPVVTALARPESMTRDNSTGYAFTILFNRWEIRYSPELDGDPCLFALRQDVQCLTGGDGLDTLQRLDRPAVLNLVAMDDDEPLQLSLIGLNEEQAVVTVGRDLRKLPRALLEERWRGSFTILWRPPRSFSLAVLPGESGPLVPWLASRRAELEQQPIQTSWTLKGDLLQWLQDFQTRQGLTASGDIDPQTLVMLQNALRDYSSPRLDVRLVD